LEERLGEAVRNNWSMNAFAFLEVVAAFDVGISIAVAEARPQLAEFQVFISFGA